MTGLGIGELMSLMEDVADFKYDSEEEVLRGPKKILPTKTTNPVATIAIARNALVVGHRFRGDVGEAM